ncbi:cysteine desulfurase [bacterium]|nr:cysteine desulfurase [bacterium]
MKPIYLDYNATTPVDPRVAEAMLPYLTEHFGNPSSSHVYGRKTREAVDRSREQVAALLGASPKEIIFTSGGSESNNLAIKGVVEAYQDKGRHILTSAVEHPAVTEVCQNLQSRGWQVDTLPVDGTGFLDPAAVEKALSDETVLVTVMHANNEVGTLQAIAEIAELAHARGAFMHTDAAQSIGKISVRVDELGADLLSLAGHKLYAPKGVGALYIREGVKLTKQTHGADHERNLRAGTENVLEIAGLGIACELAGAAIAETQSKLSALRDRLEDGLRLNYPSLIVNGKLDSRLPNTASVSFPGMEASTLLAGLSGVAASAGAACHADGVSVSAVLSAMKVPLDIAKGTLRLSVGRFTTEEEIDRAVDFIIKAL